MDGLDAIMAELSGAAPAPLPAPRRRPSRASSSETSTCAHSKHLEEERQALFSKSLATGTSGECVDISPARERNNRVGDVPRSPTAARTTTNTTVPPSTSMSATKQRSLQVGGESLDSVIATFPQKLQKRVKYFEEKLKQFALNLADPASRQKTNVALAQESFDDFVGYYRKNPKLAQYSVKQDLQRLDYRVIPHGARDGPSAALTDPVEIVAYYDQFVQERMHMAAAAQSADIQKLLSESDLLWRMANQSLLATILGHIKKELVDGADGHGELNATIRSTAVRFEIDFPRDTLQATSTLSIAIIGLDPLSGDPSTTEVVEASVSVVVDLRDKVLEQKLKRVTLRPAILETQLRAAAAGLARDEALLSKTPMMPGKGAGTASSDTSEQRLSSPSSLAGGIKAKLSSVAAAYERSGGLWGTVARLAGATPQQLQPRRHSPQRQHGQLPQDHHHHHHHHHQAPPPMPHSQHLHGTQDEKGPAYNNNAQTHECADFDDDAGSFAALFDRVSDEGPSTDITQPKAAFFVSKREDASTTTSSSDSDSAGGVERRSSNTSSTNATGDKYEDLFDF